MTKPRRPPEVDGVHFALSADSVAAALDISLTTLGTLVAEDKIPKPFRIPGHPKLVRWDPDDIQRTVKGWKDEANTVSDGDWGEIR